MLTKAVHNVIIALGVLMCFPTLAHADEWADAFDSDAVATYLPDESAKVLVIAPGAENDELDELSRTLAKAIHDVEGTTSVRIPSLDRKDAEDKELLEHARTVRADTVLIVRLFESEDTATAVGTFYRPNGDAYSAFAVERGDSLESREAAPKPTEKADPRDETPKAEQDATSPGEGVSQEAADAVESVTVSERTDTESKVATYHSEMLRVEKRGDKMRFYRGLHDDRISSEEFFAALDREELDERYQKSRTRKAVLSSVAMLGFVGSGVLTFASIASDDSNPLVTGAAAGGMALSLAVFVGTQSSDPFPLSYNEAQRAVYEHNEELREELDIPANVETMSSDVPAIELDVGVGSVGDGAGFILKGSF